MRQELSGLQKVKTGIHVLQALLIFIAACITIAVFTGPGRTDGRSKWFFTLCWLSIPALIYLAAVPMWSRAANVAKSLWFAIVDALFTVFWLSAFAAVLAWNRAGITKGAKDKKVDLDQSSCKTFADDVSEKQCKLSYTASSFGAIICVLFIATTAISIIYTLRSRKNPTEQDPWLAPESHQPYMPTPGNLENGGSASKDPIWDTNTGELDGIHDADSDSLEESEQQHNRRNGNQQIEDEYAPLHGDTETEDGLHPGRPWGPLGTSGREAVSIPPLPQVDTEYRSPAGNYQAPSALSPNNYHAEMSFSRPGPAAYDASNDYKSKGASGARYSFSQPDARG